jgi:orotidine-5'-phosphate decarboxylase
VSTFYEKLQANNAAGRYACAGLDPVDSKIPEDLRALWENDTLIAWCTFLYELIRASETHAAAFKPNLAFFLARGYRGLRFLEDVCQHIHDTAPHALLILDMKVGDIADTNAGYVEFAFNICKADAITIHPYLGYEAMKPFLADPNRGAFVLAKTSNPGSGEFQDLLVQESGLPLYAHVSRNIQRHWNENANCGLVVGATYPTQLEKVVVVAPNLPILIPGIGKQGGDLETIVRAVTSNGPSTPFILNQSSGFMYASGGEDFAEAGAKVLQKMNEGVQNILSPVIADDATVVPS